MGKSANKLGKAVGNSFGYTIRMIVTGKTNEKTKKTDKVHTGKYGVYAGKNLVPQGEVKTITEGMEKIQTIVNTKRK